MSSSSTSAHHQASSNASSSLPRLGPAWRSRGFQPPPAVPSDPRGDHESFQKQQLHRARSGSSGSIGNKSDVGPGGSGGGGGTNSNSFSAFLQLDGGVSDDEMAVSNANGHHTNSNTTKHHNMDHSEDGISSGNMGSRRISMPTSTKFMSRSDALMGIGTSRSTHNSNHSHAGGFRPLSSSSTSNFNPPHFKSTGRSLADLVANTPSSGDMSRRHSSGYGGGSGYRVSDSAFRDRSGVEHHDQDKKIIRYTRERLLSMRPQPREYEGVIPPSLKHLATTSVISKFPQDPVCFDDFDADEIWSQSVPPRSTRGGGNAGGGNVGPSSSMKQNTNNSPMSLRGLAEGSLRARSEIDSLGTNNNHHSNSGSGSGSSSGGRWQRGVALPPASDIGDGKRGTLLGGGNNRKSEEAEHPEDLWDDPIDVGNAAADLSQFGALLDDETGSPLCERKGVRGVSGPSSGPGPGGLFDLADMSEAAKRFESELHGNRRSDSFASGDDEDNLDSNLGQRVDPKRPLAFAGTTIRSGSGDDVNVFEDFGAPAEAKTIPGVDDNNNLDQNTEDTASSRLMKMIGVDSSSSPLNDVSESKLMSSWGGATEEKQEDALPKPQSDSALGGPTLTSFSNTPLASTVPKNPWGNPILTTNNIESISLTQSEEIDNKTAAMRAVEEEQQRQQLNATEEQKRQANIQAQLAAQRQAAEAQRQQQQQASVHQQSGRAQYNTQVEQILMERISIALEGAWGRADLGTLLSTLHTEDPRVIPLLGSIEDLKALISRHSNRVAIASGPGYGVEMAVLLMTTNQFQQRQMQQQREEEFQRQRQLMQKMQAMKIAEEEARARERAVALAAQQKHVTITNDPWYYADPQGNIQGPFKGEEMRQWLDAGYFKGDLPISQNPNTSFHTLTSLFPDPSIAFQTPSVSDLSKEEVKKLAIAKEEEESRKKAEQAARAAELERIEAEKKANEERARQKAAADEALATKLTKELGQQSTKTSDLNSSSVQLKMLLGLNNTATQKDTSNETDQIVVATASQPNNSSPQSQSEPAGNSPLQPPKTSQPQSSIHRSTIPSTNTPAPVPSQPAWGGAASVAKPGKKKSMSEIQQEEARVAARLAKQNERLSRSSSGGWANVAASGGGGTGWSSGAVKPVRSTSSVSTSSGVTSGPSQVRPKQVARAASTGQTLPTTKSTPQQQAKASVIEDFGVSGKMNSSLESWCKEQMRKLNGSDDLTLVAFCMTLSDPLEIRQYLTAYLGSSSQVGNFATEFINRKGGGKAKQEEWESAGNAKKGRKKKTNQK